MRILIILAITIGVIYAGAAIAVTGNDQSRAIQAVLDGGYMNPQETGTVFLGCSQDDSIFTSKYITAVNANGKSVELTVCCGLLFKGCTIRH